MKFKERKRLSPKTDCIIKSTNYLNLNLNIPKNKFVKLNDVNNYIKNYIISNISNVKKGDIFEFDLMQYGKLDRNNNLTWVYDRRNYFVTI